MKEESIWNNPQVRTWAFWAMILTVIILCFYMIYYVHNGSIQCMSNPWSYQLKQIRTNDGIEPTCSCTCSFLPSGDSIFITTTNSTILSLNINNNLLIKP